MVKEFFLSPSISRPMPGMRDYIIVNENGGKEKAQKQLMLCSLKESYLLFKELYPDKKIGFGNFVGNRPPNTVFPGTSGTHNVCVCKIHQVITSEI